VATVLTIGVILTSSGFLIFVGAFFFRRFAVLVCLTGQYSASLLSLLLHARLRWEPLDWVREAIQR